MHSQAHQDLALIRRVMDETRREVNDRGKHFLIWGVLTSIGLAATYLAVTGRLNLNPATAWIAVLVVGWAASMTVGWMDGRRARVVTLGRRLLTAVWVSTAVTLTATAIGGMFGSVLPVNALPGVLAVIVAAPMLVTALLTGEAWLHWVAAGWWIGGGVMLFVPGVYTLLLMTAMSVVLMAGPGVILYGRSRRAPLAPEPIEG